MSDESLQDKSTAAATLMPGVPVEAARARTNTTTLLELLMQLPDPEKQGAIIKTLADVEAAKATFEMDQRHARMYAMSTYFDDLKGESMEQSLAKAMVKVQIGRAWGFNAADSMKHIYFVNGRPAIEQEIVASKLYQHGWKWDIKFHEIPQPPHDGAPDSICVGCTLLLSKWNSQDRVYLPYLDSEGKRVEVSFTKGDADRAMIWEKGKQIPLSQKSNWIHWARNMYYWRAVSLVRKFHAPDVLRGGRVFEEHIDVVEDEPTPPVIEAPSARPPAPPPVLLADLVAGDESIPVEDEPKP